MKETERAISIIEQLNDAINHDILAMYRDLILDAMGISEEFLCEELSNNHAEKITVDVFGTLPRPIQHIDFVYKIEDSPDIRYERAKQIIDQF